MNTLNNLFLISQYKKAKLKKKLKKLFMSTDRAVIILGFDLKTNWLQEVFLHFIILIYFSGSSKMTLTA